MENWKPIEGYPAYAVSDHGHIRRVVDCPRTGNKAGLMIKPGSCGRGNRKRQLVRLSNNGTTLAVLVHRLVMLYFGPEKPEGKYIVAHNDGNGMNNHISNLRWATYKENTADRIKHGTDMRGEQCRQSRMTKEMVAEIHAAPKYRGYIKDLAIKFGVDRTTVSKVVNGNNWRHVAQAEPDAR